VNAGNNSGFRQIHTDLGAANELGCTIGTDPALALTSDAGIGGLVLAGLLAGGKVYRRRKRG